VQNLEEKIVKSLQEIKEIVKGLCKIWMNVDECSVYIRMSKNSIFAKTSKHEIPYYRVGKRIIFKTSEIDAWLETNCKVKSNAELETDVSTAILKKGLGGAK